MNTLKIIEGQSKQAHLDWLKFAKTAKIDGVELTVLPYGYLSQAVRQSCAKSIIQIISAEIERKRGMKKELVEVEPNLFAPIDATISLSGAIGYNQALEEDIAHLTVLLDSLK